MYRKTYVKVNLSHLQNNVSKIIQKYHEYQYYFGVVKANAYGHGLEAIGAIIKGGCNYLAVALLEEALEIRSKFPDIPILCLGVVTSDEIDLCIKNNITVTVNSLKTVQNISVISCSGLKVHIKLNTGMNRLGISKEEDLKETIKQLKQLNVLVEGIYTHIYEASSEVKTKKQFERFQELVMSISCEDIPIIHVSASEALTSYQKLDFVNGCRLGIIMYGFTEDSSLMLEATFSLHSKVIQINMLESGETVGYHGTFQAEEKTYIAVVPIGYADGMIRKNKGRTVYIQNHAYPIVGNICMDMLFIKVDEQVQLGDEVVLLKDIAHIEEVAKHLETIPYEVLCLIGSRVPRVYY